MHCLEPEEKLQDVRGLIIEDEHLIAFFRAWQQSTISTRTGLKPLLDLFSYPATTRRRSLERTLHWKDEQSDDDGVRSRALLSHDAVVGFILQFPTNAPTTYASVHERRIGAFESWEAAMAAVEREASQ